MLVDNYDSFTWNLVQLFRESGLCHVSVVKNDAVNRSDLESCDALVLSPGPGLPHYTPNCCSLVNEYAGKLPILGVCLGHQAIAEAFGGRLFNLAEVRHGCRMKVHAEGDDAIFGKVSMPFYAGLYHSWAVSDGSFPDCLQVIARSEENVIMGIKHKTYPIYGLQFHPESFMTDGGKRMIVNWLIGY